MQYKLQRFCRIALYNPPTMSISTVCLIIFRIKAGYAFFALQQGVKIPNVLIGVFIVIDPFDHTAVLASQLGYRTGANCQNRVGLVHHIHIIETIITRLAPAYILQIARDLLCRYM